MSKRTTLAFLTVAALMALSFVGGRSSAAPPPGAEPYTPTKLEWAALRLTASVGSAYGAYVLQFVPSADQKTVEAQLTWGRSKESLSRNAIRGFVKDRFEDFRTQSGWSWLQLRIIELDRSGPSSARGTESRMPSNERDGKR